MSGVQFVDVVLSKFSNQGSAIALDSQGRVFTWGSNEFGQLGQGDSRCRKLPTMLLGLKRKQIT
jgi:alpha-tubulin suppressor-like RCC1 family protein